MKSVYELLRQKEAELQQIGREVEALRITIKLLESENAKPATVVPVAPQAPAISAPVQGTYSAVHADLVQQPATYVKAAAGPAPGAAVPARVAEPAVAEAAAPKNYWP